MPKESTGSNTVEIWRDTVATETDPCSDDFGDVDSPIVETRPIPPPQEGRHRRFKSRTQALREKDTAPVSTNATMVPPGPPTFKLTTVGHASYSEITKVESVVWRPLVDDKKKSISSPKEIVARKPTVDPKVVRFSWTMVTHQ